MQKNTPGLTHITKSLKNERTLYLASYLTFLATPEQSLTDDTLFPGTFLIKVINFYNQTCLGYVKMHGWLAMACNAILKNGGIPRESIISQLFLTLDYKTWYQIRG